MHKLHCCVSVIILQDHCVESDDEKSREISDLDDTYWEPADSINELYKQLSSNKYREIPPHQVKYAWPFLHVYTILPLYIASTYQAITSYDHKQISQQLVL